MKAKLTKRWKYFCDPIPEGTEVTIIKGMEADAADVLNTPYGMCYLCEHEGNNHYIPATYFTITDYSNVDWEQVRIQAAIAMMQAITTDGRRIDGTIEDAAKVATRYADALINELQKKQP